MFRSLKQIKIYAVLLVCTLAFFALFGCTPKENEPSQEEDTGIVRSYTTTQALTSQREGAYKITYPVTPELIKKSNGITITNTKADISEIKNTEPSAEQTDESESSEPVKEENLVFSDESLSYIVIDGLLNEDVEKKINDTIYNTALELFNAKLPPYRGIRTVDFSGYTDLTKQVYVYETANFSNILSVGVSLNISGYNKSDGTSQSVYITETVPLNFYLKTGEQFPLGDLFADNCDYKKIINGEISDYLMKYNRSAGDRSSSANYFGDFSSISVVSPFKGISDNQRFIINENSISLIIDYNMPEFDTTYSDEYGMSFTSLSIDIPYSEPEISEVLGVFKRFETEDSLYENERQKSFITSNYPVKSVSMMYASPEDFGLQKVTEGYVDISFSNYIPLTINNKELSDAMNAKYDAAEDHLLSLVNSTLSKYPGAQISISYSHSVNRLGKYITEAETDFVYVYSNNADGKYNLNKTTYTIYDEKTGEEVTLGELFKDGVDYRMELLEAIKAQRSQYMDKDSDPLPSDEYFLEVIDNGDVMLYQSSLQITYAFPDGTYEYCYIPFEFLNQDSLVIFD